MDFLINFVLSIIGSIIATVIIFLTAAWASKNVRLALTAIASTFLKIEVKYVFDNSRDAEQATKEALEKGSDIRIFTGRGNQFLRDTYSMLLQKDNQKNIRILLPNPSKTSNKIDWIDHREQELAPIGKSYKNGMLRQQIKNVIKYLESYIESGQFEIRLYDGPHIARIILTEKYLFLQPYKKALEGRDSPVIQYGRGDMYEMFNRYFNILWEDSEIVVPTLNTF